MRTDSEYRFQVQKERLMCESELDALGPLRDASSALILSTHSRIAAL